MEPSFYCKYCDYAYSAEEWNKRNPDPYSKLPDDAYLGEFFCPGCDEFIKSGEMKPV